MLYTSLVLCLWTLSGVFGDEVKSVSAMEGQNVTLHTDLTHIQTHDDSVEWRFGVKGPLIIRIKRSVNINPTYEDNNNTEIFRDKLNMNNQTGDLTITHITSQHSGLYHLKIKIGTFRTVKNFSLSVYSPTPVSISESTQTPSSSSPSSSSSSSSSSSESSAGFVDPQTPVYITLVSCAVAVGSLLILTLLIFCICRKHRDTREEVQTREDDVTYADATFYKRDRHIEKVKEEDDEVVYADVNTKR
ncbi:hypothetical protein E1301_Tti019111 [Triplophysa tibetana]|uniref:Immunoglobulin domain-containing protein n=1 Tax=Triplophysa tibetana TaxID=1572043 RepID=A0A5A9NSB5_9TELE|nr:hypothetical protein E1301_Tti019111 [Triplophysa tibetana]